MFWERYNSLCAQKGMSANAVAKIIGKSSGSVTFWKNGKVPHHSTLIKIADYFGVTVDYLLGKEEKKPTAEAVGNDNQLLNEAEQLMDALSPARQEEALRYLRYLASQEGKDMP